MDETLRMAEAFSRFDTPSVTDAMDKLNLYGALLGIRAVAPGTKFCGPAFTVRYVPCGAVKGTVGDFLDDVPRGGVVVLDNAGREHCTVWGDLMSIYASKNGIAGTVIDGVCRDVPVIRELQYPIFTRGCYPVTGKDRVEVAAVNEPVTIAGVLVKPGDIMLGDDTGAVAIPLERAADILEAATDIAEKERRIEEAVRRGGSLREARAKTGYHKLQTPDA